MRIRSLLLTLGLVLLSSFAIADVGDVNTIATLSPKNAAFQDIVRSTNVAVATTTFTNNFNSTDLHLQGILNKIDQFNLSVSSTNVILNQNFLQNGATFYVSSGTVNNLNLTTINGIAYSTNTLTSISTNTTGASNFIFNQSTLQAGSTFYVSSGTVAGQESVTSIKFADGTIQVSSAPTSGGSGTGGYAVQPATVTFQLNQGFSASTETLTSLSPGVVHIVATSSNVVTGLVSLSTEVTGILPLANMSSGATYYIQNTNTLQSGATFYVSSGTVKGNFYLAPLTSGIGEGAYWDSVLGNLNFSSNTFVGYNTNSPSYPVDIEGAGIDEGVMEFIVGDVIGIESIGGTYGGYFQGNAASVYALAGTNNAIPIYVQGMGSQVADLQEWRGAGVTLASVTANGAIVTSSSVTAVNFRDTSLSNTVLAVDSTGLLISTTVSGGGGGSGTVTSVGSGFGLTGGPITTSGTLTVDTTTLSGNFILNQNTLQSGATFYVSSGTVNGQLSVTTIKFPDGTIQVSSAPTTGGGGTSPGGSDKQLQYDNAGSFGGLAYTSATATGLQLIAQASTNIPLIVNGAASQSADLQDWDSSSGSILASMSSGGGLTVQGLSSIGAAQANDLITSTIYGGSNIDIYPNGGGSAGATGTLDYTSGNLGNLAGVQTTNITNGYGTLQLMPAGGKVGIGTSSPSSTLHVQSNSTGTVTEIIQSMTSQSADLQEWQNSSGVALASVTASGVFTGSGAGLTNIPAANLTGKVPDSTLDSSSVTLQGNNFNSGSELAQLNGGLVPTANLGSGSATSSTYLRGDQTWAAVSSGGTTPGATYYIQNTNSLQAGATFYVSSGSISGQLGFPGHTTDYYMTNVLSSGSTDFLEILVSTSSTKNIQLMMDGYGHIGLSTGSLANMGTATGLNVTAGVMLSGGDIGTSPTGNNGGWLAFPYDTTRTIGAIGNIGAQNVPGGGIGTNNGTALGFIPPVNLFTSANEATNSFFPVFTWGDHYSPTIRIQDGTDFAGFLILASTTSQTSAITEWRDQNDATFASIDNTGRFSTYQGYVPETSEAFGHLCSTTTNSNEQDLTAMGYSAAEAATSGIANTYIGAYCGQKSRSAIGNTAVGYTSLQSVTVATGNVSVGYSTLNGLTTGQYNTAIGDGAGDSFETTNYRTVTASEDTFIGYESSQNSPNQLFNATAIGALATVAQSSCVALGNAASVVIGTNTGNGTLFVMGISSLTPVAVFRSSTSATGDLQEWQNNSGTALSSVTAAGNIIAPNLIYNQNSLQAGSTFYTSSGTVSGTLGVSTITAPGTSSNPGVNIVGSNTNDSAPQGDFGEFVSSFSATYGTWPAASNAFGNLLSVSLTGGTWRCDGYGRMLEYTANISASSDFYDIAISTNSGNTTTDQVFDRNQTEWLVSAVTGGAGGWVTYRVAVPSSASPENVYLKVQTVWSSGIPAADGGLQCWRTR